MKTLLIILAVVLVVLGLIFFARGNPFAGEMFWYGPMEETSVPEDKRQFRLALLGVTLLLAGAGLLKYASAFD